MKIKRKWEAVTSLSACYVWLEKYFSRGDYKKQMQDGTKQNLS